jgi:two-component system chemotaxis response regulator CheY
MLALPCEASLDIALVQTWHSRLQEVLALQQPVMLEAAQVERADTAALQLLCVFIQEATAQGVAVHWREPSPALRNAARLLDLTGYLSLPGKLAVDDSASMRQMVTFTLKGAGYNVVEARDGAEALAVAKTTKVDLVLTDINMPNMDGLSLIRALRALPTYKFTPILTLTTESTADKKQEGKAAGATGWIVKPFNPEQLLAVVQKVLG